MAAQLYAGAGKAKITPSEDLLPYMFGLMNHLYCKIHDDLYVRALALQAGEQKAMIIVYDLDKATNPAEWTAELEKATGIPAQRILYLAIHTHTAPLTGYRPFEGPNFIERKAPEVQEKVHEYEAFLLPQLLKAAKEAIANLQPARFGYARGTCDINVNRNQLFTWKNPDGTTASTVSVGFNADGIVDRTQTVLRFENAETGAPIAFLSHYSVHCVAAFENDTGDGKSFLSGDIGGQVSRTLEAEYPGAVALWTSAPAGDVNPVQMVQTCFPDMVTGKPSVRHLKGEDAAEATIYALAGRQLASIREVLGRIKCNISEADIHSAESWAEVPCTRGITNDFSKLNDTYRIRTHLLQVGPLAMIGIDGELYTSLGHAIQAASPVADTLVFNHDSSLLLDNPGYIYDDEASDRIRKCVGAGGPPGHGVTTAPGTVKAALEASTRELFKTAE